MRKSGNNFEGFFPLFRLFRSQDPPRGLNQMSDGLEIEEAEDWRTSFEKIASFNPHVVLLDIEMPEVPGKRLVRTIKQLKPEVEIIVLSATVSDEVKAQCLSHRALDVMEKPVALDALKTRIVAALGRTGYDPSGIGGTNSQRRAEKTSLIFGRGRRAFVASQL